MDCLQLQLQSNQLRTQPFHYLINEQAKSLLALQELQNEVGALLEFRDLVMETFPNLRQKMSSSGSHTFSNTQNYCSNLPLPLSGSLNSRQWEPGIKVKRKILSKSDNESSLGRVRSNSHTGKIQSSQPKSSDAISGVQDSGFSTETNSSNKDHGSSTATSVPLPCQPDDPFLTKKDVKTPRRTEYDRSDEELSEDGLVLKVNEAEEELWNLLDVIHTKGTKLREEVETLQLKLVIDEIENHLKDKELEIKKSGKKFSRRCRSLENFDNFINSLPASLVETIPLQPNFKYHDLSVERDVFRNKRTRSIELEDVDRIRQERNMLLDKVAEMETENMENRIKTSELQNEISALINTKEELQEQLLLAVKQKNELNTRIHELHLKFVSGDRKFKLGGKTEKSNYKDLTDSESSQSEIASLTKSRSSDDTHKIISSAGSKNDRKKFMLENGNWANWSCTQNLGALDGIISNPKKFTKFCKLSENSKKKIEAILKEKNYLELQRHLLVFVVQNQVLSSQLETSIKSQDDLCEELMKCKKDNDDLLFQLKDKNIELEGTKAQVRVLEKLHHQPKCLPDEKLDDSKPGENFLFLENDHLRSRGFSESEINRARQIFLESQNKKVDKSELLKGFNRTRNSSPQKQNEVRSSFDLGKTSNVIPILALPLPTMSSHQSNETESTQALEISSELEADMTRVDKNESLKNDKSPYRRRPSKIPLNIQKTTKNLKSGLNGGSPSLKKSDGELNKSKDFNVSLKKCSLDNSQNSMTSRNLSQNSNSIKYNSVGRTGSQLSVVSQRSNVPARTDKKKSLTNSQKEDNSLTTGKNSSLRQASNFSSVRQRETLTRKNQCEGLENDGKRTVRSSFRESFRSRISIDGNSLSSKKDGPLSGVRKDSLHLIKQNRSNSVQQKTYVNKSILSTNSENTKLKEKSLNEVIHTHKEADNTNEKDFYQRSSTSHQSPPIKQDSNLFSDSLNSSSRLIAKTEKFNIFKEVRENFQRRLAEKFGHTFFTSKLISTPSAFLQSDSAEKNVWLTPKEDCDLAEKFDLTVQDLVKMKDLAEMNFFDSIDNLLDIDKDDSLLNNSSYYFNETIHNEAMAEIDSLEVRLSQLD